MDVRAMRKAVRAGAWTLSQDGEVAARTEFQKGRLTAAVTTARLYLESDYTTEQIGKTLAVTAERAAQVVRTGLNYMLTAGWLRPAEPGAPRPSTPS